MIVIGHRGACAYAPENTFSAFDLAVEMGCHAIETDVRLTADNALVLIHDSAVDRTTDGTGQVSDLTLAMIESLDAGSWFSPEFAGARIPTLGGFLARYGGKVRLNLELKADDTEQQAVSEVESAGLVKETVFTSFLLDRLLRLKKVAPNAACGYLVKELNSENIRLCLNNDIGQICPRAAGISATDLSEAKSAGLEVRAWGIDSEATMHRAVQAGFDGMTVDFPDRLLGYVSNESGD